MQGQEASTAVARGERTGRQRRVRPVSLILVVIALAIAWLLMRPG